MAGTISPTATGLSMVDFQTGVDATGRLNALNGWSWNNNSIRPEYFPANGGAHSFGSGASISYGLNPAYAWTASETRYTAQAFGIWSAVANVTFQQVDFASAAIKYNRPPTGGADAGADDYTAGQPGSKTVPVATAGTINVTTAGGFGTIDSYLDAGGYGPSTVVHEVGHILGLMHSGPYNGAVVSSRDQSAPEDTYLGSIMSYIPPGDARAKFYRAGTDWVASDNNTYVAQSPMQYDILGIQRLYGTPTSGPLTAGGQVFGFNSNTGLDVYDFTKVAHPIVTLWDAGLNNTLDVSGFADPSRIDLNPGAYSDTDAMTNNVSIAFGTRIDRAIGGAGDDVFILNLYDDAIDGGAGANTVVMPGNLAQYSYGFAGGAVTATSLAPVAGGNSVLRNVQQLRFADGSTTNATALPHRFDYTDTAASVSGVQDGVAYAGPVTSLKWQNIWSSPDAVSMRANAASAFLKGGIAGDALQATGGSNVLDGGLGSNFLVGATGADGGADVFFADARGGGTTWSTLVNFHKGDAATIWGFVGGQSTYAWSADEGATGYTGATIHASTVAGSATDASFTFAGVALADAEARFTITTGNVGGNDYMLIQSLT